MKTLMLTGKNNIFFDFDKINRIKVEKCDVYKKGKIVKVFRNIKVLAGFSLESWKKDIRNYDLIICIDSTMTLWTLKWIVKRKKNARVILYFRNKFDENDKRWTLSELKGLNIEIWSYNIHDCKKYGFVYNPQTLYFREFNKRCKKDVELKYGVSFVGSNKNRLNQIEKVNNLMNNIKLKTYMYMVDAPDLKDNQCVDNKHIDYGEYLNVLNESYAILDLVTEENKGLTLRPIEALFLKKKLITNYKEIKYYDFYLKDNIWILGEDDECLIDKFIYSPFKELPQEVVLSYDTNEWFKRFLTYGNKKKY